MASISAINSCRFQLTLDKPAPDGSTSADVTVDFSSSRTAPTLSVKYGSSTTLTFGGTVSGGTYTLTVQVGSAAAQTTAPIAYNANAATVQAALAALSNVGNGNVNVTGGPGPGTPLVVTFTGTEGQPASGTGGGPSPGAVVVTANGASLTGTSPTITPSSALTTLTPAINYREIVWENLAGAFDDFAGALETALRTAAGQPLSWSDISAAL